MIVARIIFNHLSRVEGELREKISLALARSAMAIEQDVKGGGPHAAPYRTGNLRRSYHHRREHDLLYIVENDPELAPYAIYVEFGTCKMAARPHLTPAAEAERPELDARMKELLRGYQ